MANQAVHGNTAFHIGDTIRVHYKLIEKEKVAGKTKREVKLEVRERIQVFEGMVIALKGEGNGKMLTVRRIGAGNIGVERVFPLISPWIKKITVKSRGRVRRAKLYFLRKKSGKEADKIIQSERLAEDKKAEKVELSTPPEAPPVIVAKPPPQAHQNEEPKK